MKPRSFRATTSTICLIALLGARTSAGPAEPPARVQAFASVPDWSGLWETEAQAALVTRGTLPAIPQLWDKPPYTAAAEKKYAPGGFPFSGAKNFFAVPNGVAPTVKVCKPFGFPGITEMLFEDGMFELLVTAKETLLVAADGTIRHIYTDGRPHPKPEDLWPTPTGDSIGHWEGDTLIIDTIAREAGPIVPYMGAANLSEKAHFTERLHRIGPDTLEDQLVIDDPQRFSHPWHVTIRYAREKFVDRMIPIGGCAHDRDTVGERYGIAPPR